MKRLLQKGDTIVEVLIASVIVSIVLVGSFTISNLSLKQIRMAQERSEAQKLAQQSVESLDQMVADTSNSLTTRTAAFCKADGSYVAVNISSVCDSGTDNRYHTSIVRQGTAPSYGFAVTVKWDNLRGSEEQVVINYRAGSN